MFSAANQIAVSEHLLNEAAKAVSFSDALVAAYTVLALLLGLLWAIGVLVSGRVEAQNRSAIAVTGAKRRDGAVRAPRNSLLGRHTPAL